MFFAHSKLAMGTTWGPANRSGDTNPTTGEADYSVYTLRQLLKARRYFDGDRYTNREGSLEEEIEKRCAHFQEPAKRAGSGTAARSGHRYRLYGVTAGVFFLVVSSGPFIAVELLAAMNLITDVNGDNALLSGTWALLTLPFAVTVFMIGAIMDAGRVVKWLNL